MTESQKDAIRRDRLHMSGAEVARKHGVTRQRIDQIIRQQPNEAKRAAEIALGVEPYEDEPVLTEQPADHAGLLVRFRIDRLNRFEDASIQAAIRSEFPNYTAIARKYETTVHVVRRIRCEHKTGRPIRNGRLTMSGEQRSEHQRKCSEGLRRYWATIPFSERSARLKARHAKFTPEQLRQRGLKAAATRKARLDTLNRPAR